MKIYRLSQLQEGLHIEVENLFDRTRVYLKDIENKIVGKLTIQFDAFDEGKDAVTAFRIEPQYRGKGWGRKMMDEALKNQKKQLYVSPEPYGDEAGKLGTKEYNDAIDKLHNMYKGFGFKEHEDNFMVRDNKIIQQK